MSRRSVKKDTKRLGDQADDIELRNTFDDPIKSAGGPSPYDVPKEDRAGAPHAFASDVDQQKLLAQLKSEVAALREQVASMAKRIEMLERDRGRTL
jgi:hypothetical protein